MIYDKSRHIGAPILHFICAKTTKNACADAQFSLYFILKWNFTLHHLQEMNGEKHQVSMKPPYEMSVCIENDHQNQAGALFDVLACASMSHLFRLLIRTLLLCCNGVIFICFNMCILSSLTFNELDFSTFGINILY